MLWTTRMPSQMASSRMEILKSVEIPMAHGFAFTAIRSGTGMGFEVSSRGGSLTGKNTSWTRSQRLTQMGSSLNAVSEECIQLVAGLWNRGSLVVLLFRCHESIVRLLACAVPAVPACLCLSPDASAPAIRPIASIMLDRTGLCLAFHSRLTSRPPAFSSSSTFSTSIRNRRSVGAVCYREKWHLLCLH